MLVAIIGVLGFGTGTAHAENTVANSSPLDGAQLGDPPEEILIGFEDDIGDGSTIQLDCDSESVDLPDPEVLDDDKTLRVELPATVPSGTCTTRYTVTNTDGDPDGEGLITFVIANALTGAVDTTDTTPADDNTGAPADSTPADDAADESTPLTAGDDEVVDLSIAGEGNAALWLGRLLSTLGIATLFGSLLMITAAWPEGVEYLVTIKFLRVVWIGAVIGTLLFTALAAGAVTPDGGGSGFNPGTWFDLVDAGWAGRAALLRLVLLLGSAWVAFRPDRAIDPTTQLAALGIPGLCVAMLGLTRTVGPLPVLGVTMGVLHAIAMAVWVGGVILLARVVLAGPGDEDLVHAVRGFGRVSTPAIVVTIVTGVVQMIRLDGGALFTSGHGRVVVLKAIVVAVMIFVAISARQFVAQRLNRAQQMTVPLSGRLRRAFGAEAGFGLLTLAMSSWLLAFNPPNVSAIPSVDYAVEQVHTVESADLEVEVKLTDDMVALVGLEVVVNSPEDGLSNVAVVLNAPADSPTLRGYRQPIPLTGEGTAVRDAEIGLPISLAGDWTIQVEATTAAGSVTSDPQVYTVTDDDGPAGTGGSTPPEVELVPIPDTEPPPESEPPASEPES